MSRVDIIQERATNLALLNDFIAKVEPPTRKHRAIVALLEANVISQSAADLLIEEHGLQA